MNGWFPDTTAALFGACVLLAMVRQARATGTGGHYEVAQLEAAAWLLPEMALIDTGAPGDWNDDQHVPIAQAFRTGDDGDVWVWLAVGDMDEWKTVLGVLDLDPAVRPGPDAVAAAIARMPRADLCDRLQARGVECVPVLDAADLVTDEHLAVRGAFVTVEHTEVGPMRTYGRVVHDRRAPASDAPLRPAPVMGEHNDEVLLEGLGVGRAEYEALVADGVIA